jgi:chromosome segregation ATPase
VADHHSDTIPVLARHDQVLEIHWRFADGREHVEHRQCAYYVDSRRADGKLDRILAHLEGLMATQADLKKELDTIKDGVANLLTKATANAQTIAELQAQVADGSPVTQQQLDDLSTEAQGIVDTLTPLAPPAV